MFRPLGAFILWNLIVGAFLLLLEPLVALPLALAASAALLWGYILRPRPGGRVARRWATLRLRPLDGATLRWTLVAVPVLIVLSWTLGDVYTRFVPVPPETLNPFEPVLGTAGGRLLITVFAIGVAPIIEEFTFRGLIQHEVERRRGPVVGIAVASALFAAVHVLPWILPLHFFLGVAFGFAVWVTRSIWAGVLLHAANNSAAMIGVALSGEDPAPNETLWESGLTADLWFSIAALVLSGIAGAWTAGKLYQQRKRGGN